MENRHAPRSLALLALPCSLMLACGPTVALPGDAGPDTGRDAGEAPDAGPPPDSGPEPCLEEAGSRVHWHRDDGRVATSEVRLGDCGVRLVSGVSLIGGGERALGNAYLAATDGWLYEWRQGEEPSTIHRFSRLEEVPGTLFAGIRPTGQPFAGGVFGVRARTLDTQGAQFSTASPIVRVTDAGLIPFRPRSMGVAEIAAVPFLFAIDVDHSIVVSDSYGFIFGPLEIYLRTCPGPDVDVDEILMLQWQAPDPPAPLEARARAGSTLYRLDTSTLCLSEPRELTDEAGATLEDISFTVVRRDALLYVENP